MVRPVTLTDHIESHLGSIEAGWSKNVQGWDMPFQVVRCGDGFGAGTVAFTTLGLSRCRLASPMSDKLIRQELVCAVYSTEAGHVPALLQTLGSEMLARRHPLLRGDVISLPGHLFPNSAMRAVYISLPVYLPDSFEVYEPGSVDTVMSWVVPITEGEAQFVSSHGWDAFEDLLEAQDPNLLDVRRPELNNIH